MSMNDGKGEEGRRKKEADLGCWHGRRFVLEKFSHENLALQLTIIFCTMTKGAWVWGGAGVTMIPRARCRKRERERDEEKTKRKKKRKKERKKWLTMVPLHRGSALRLRENLLWLMKGVFVPARLLRKCQHRLWRLHIILFDEGKVERKTTVFFLLSFVFLLDNERGGQLPHFFWGDEENCSFPIIFCGTFWLRQEEENSCVSKNYFSSPWV